MDILHASVVNDLKGQLKAENNNKGEGKICLTDLRETIMV